ncbi:hypothetical protein AB3S75_045252 [Citrus x aurantiifolia]
MLPALLRLQLRSLQSQVVETATIPRTVPPKEVFNLKSADHDARQDAQRHNTGSHACSSVKSAVPSACVCLLDFMETSNPALATITGKLREEDRNALELIIIN